MNDKCTNQNIIHQLPAGLMQGDYRTELFGDRKSKRVFAISNGQTLPFSSLSANHITALRRKLEADDIAKNDLKDLPPSKQLEQFAFCVFGAADSEADFSETGELQSDDNFMCSENCKCLKWKSKNISVNSISLSTRKIQVIKLLATDLCDKQIAERLDISQSTLDTHKTQLFKVFGVYSKTGLITKAINLKIIQ